MEDESERRNLCLLEIWVDRNTSLTQQMAKAGEIVRGIIHLIEEEGVTGAAKGSSE